MMPANHKASTSSVPAAFIKPTMHLATLVLTLAAAGSSLSVFRARCTQDVEDCVRFGIVNLLDILVVSGIPVLFG